MIGSELFPVFFRFAMIRLIKYITGDYVMAKITITDIAKQAGVAKSTVSRYLNGGSVSKKHG